MENELKAWRERFPQYEYRQQDECIALRMNCRYGCHCDLEDGMEPDGCVLDEGRPQDCVYAGILERDGRTKEHCRYWKPVVPSASGKPTTEAAKPL